ncbi:MAG TPA: hypothetical protein VJ927_12740 [Actinomycetota bacterium]|nr:hypothetical protein [Actinomycetota bacterium]
MLDRSVLRIGGAAAMAGAVLGLVANLLHPRASGVDTSREELQLVADSDIWLLDHYLIGWSLALAGVALVCIALSHATEPARSWGRVAFGFAIGSIAIAFAGIAVDGRALKEVADAWAASPDDPALIASGDAVAQLALSLFNALIASLFGVTPIVFGVTMLMGERFPRWLGYLAIASGALGVLSSSMIYFAGPTDLSVNYIFGVASVGYTVWAFVSGWHLWNAPSGSPEPEMANSRAAA